MPRLRGMPAAQHGRPPPPCRLHPKGFTKASARQPTGCRLAATCISDAVVHYIAAMLAGTKSFSEQSSATVNADIAAFTTCFEQYAKPEKVGLPFVWTRCMVLCQRTSAEAGQHLQHIL